MSKFLEITIDYGYNKRDIFFDLDEVSLIQGITDDRGRFHFHVVLKNGFHAIDECSDKSVYDKILSEKKASQEYDVVTSGRKPSPPPAPTPPPPGVLRI